MSHEHRWYIFDPVSKLWLQDPKKDEWTEHNHMAHWFPSDRQAEEWRNRRDYDIVHRPAGQFF